MNKELVRINDEGRKQTKTKLRNPNRVDEDPSIETKKSVTSKQKQKKHNTKNRNLERKNNK